MRDDCNRNLTRTKILSDTRLDLWVWLLVSERRLCALSKRWEWHEDGLVQEKRNTSALALELRLSCTNPSIGSCKMSNSQNLSRSKSPVKVQTRLQQVTDRHTMLRSPHRMRLENTYVNTLWPLYIAFYACHLETLLFLCMTFRNIAVLRGMPPTRTVLELQDHPGAIYPSLV